MSHHTKQLTVSKLCKTVFSLFAFSWAPGKAFKFIDHLNNRHLSFMAQSVTSLQNISRFYPSVKMDPFSFLPKMGFFLLPGHTLYLVTST